MKRFFFSIVSYSSLISIALSCGCDSQKPSVQKESFQKEAAEQLQTIVDAYFESFLKWNPLFATSIGDHRFDDQMTIEIGEEYRKAMEALMQTSLAQVKSINSKNLSGQDLVTYEIFVQDLEAAEKLHQVDLSYLCPFNQFDSFFSDFAELSSGKSYVTFKTQADYENFLQRAKVVPSYIDTMIANMEEGMKKGITTPQVLVGKGLKQLQALLVPNYKESVFYQPVLSLHTVVEGPDASKIEAAYEEMIQKVIYPSYQKLEKFIREKYLSKARTTDGLCEIPGGEAYYRALVAYYTTTNLSPKEIMELGYGEVKRIKKELELAKESLGFKGDLPAFFTSLKEKTLELYPFHTAQEVIDAYWAIEKKVMQKVPEHFHLMPKAPLEIREVEKFKAENASEAYQPPNEDGSRPAIFWVPVPDPREYSAKDMETLFLHEAIPGHHFQISIQQELTNLCRYRKFMGNTAYIEGWALYAESLGKELGMYTNPYQWIGRLTLEMHRAIRLVVDTGIHWEGWSREKAIAYSVENEPSDLSHVIAEIDRYMAIPGQAVAYKVGEIKIQELKKRASSVLGSRYSEKAFHDQVLQNGSLPLSVLQEEIARYIEANKK